MKINVTIFNKTIACLKKQRPAMLLTGLLFILCSRQTQAQAPSEPTKKDSALLVTDSLSALNNPASVGDFVWIDNNINGIQDAGEPGLANVEVVLYDSLLNVIDSKYTNDSGAYHFSNIAIPQAGSKTFIVGFNNIPPDYAYTNLIADSANRYINSKSDTISGRTKPFVLHAGEVRKDIDGGIKNAPGVVLPLIINQFNGSYSDGFIQLGWNTYSEINVVQFDVERSTDGVNFRQISKVNAVSGQLNSNNDYKYLDITAQRGTNYYRLAIVDNNGNYTYSKSVMVNVDVKGISVMIVYPNPFSRRVQIRITSDKAEKVAINIINNNGVLMSTQQANMQVGDNNIAINKVDALPEGIYYIEVVSSTRSLKTKVMKLN
ncbi:MAG: T9SS type A sorting domain-containing protein [Ferruginibacter sp.]|nr:T9SS type A sorting domain-containing protein [Ferruginibacter sp.]